MSPKVTTDAGEDGVSMIELIIYLVIAALVVGLMAGIFINGLHSQTSTTDRDTATGRAGLVTDSLQRSLRNATMVNPSSGTSNTLVAVVATGTSSWQCRAWVLTSAGKLMYKSAASSFSTASTTGWTVLATGLTGTLAGGKIFSFASTTQVSYGFKVAVSAASVPITGGVTAQAFVTGAGPCW